jgi:hypothetical protein
MSPRGARRPLSLSLVVAGAGTAAALAVAAPRAAHADSNDLVLSRLGTIVMADGVPVDVVGSAQDFRSLASELGVALAPHLLTPSDTLGFGGFQFAIDLQNTSIDGTSPYWRAIEASDPAQATGPSSLSTAGIFMRKGFWFPLPSFEIGGGAVKLVDSGLWAAQAYGKFGLHEGFHDLPLPSVAVRGAVSRMMGSEDLDLTIASVDVSISKAFGLGGTANLAPYGGWNMLVIVPRSEVIDKTPNVDSIEDDTDTKMNFVFRDQQDIYRQRFFAGFKFQYYVFAITFEGALALAGSSVDDRGGTDEDCADVSPTQSCDAKDQASSQQSFSLSVGLDF